MSDWRTPAIRGVGMLIESVRGFSVTYSQQIFPDFDGDPTLPEETSVIISGFGSGFSNVFEDQTDTAGTQIAVGDYLVTPWGDANLTPFVGFLDPAVPSA